MSQTPSIASTEPASAAPAGAAPAPADWPASQWLDEDGGHCVWWCESGPRGGLPVLIVHGGPGGASRIEPTRWFEGLPVRWIAIDQRGCGRSTPRGATAGNDLPSLLHDMERLRQQLGLERWALAGGSWGARVALAYRQAHPQRVRGLFIRSPFFGSLAETRRYIAPWREWLGDAGLAWLGAESAQAVESLYREATDLLSDGAHYEPGRAADRAAAEVRLAQAWAAFDDAQSAPGGVVATGARFDAQRLPAAADAVPAWHVHAHYGLRRWGEADGLPCGVQSSAPPDWSALTAALPGDAPAGPISVVWGGADATCDPLCARQLVAALPDALGQEVEGAGHRMSDTRLAPALREAARAWAAACLA